MPFLKYNLDLSEEHVDKDLIENNMSEGKLKINFISHNGYDLNLKVKVILHEKNLPATIERIRLLGSEILTFRNEIDALNQSLTRLEAVNSKAALEGEITRANAELEGRIRELNAKFEAPLKEGFKCREYDAIAGLEAFLKLIRESSTQHHDLSPANATSITEFLKHYATVKTASENPYLKKLLSIVADPQLSEANKKGEESIPPALSSLEQGMRQVILYGDRVVSSSFFQSNKFEIGISMALWASLRTLEFSDSSSFIFCVGIFLAISKLRVSTTALLSNIADITEANKREFEHRLKEVINDIELEAQKTTTTARQLSFFATDRLTQKFNFDVRANVKGNLRTLLDVAGIRFGGS